MNSVAIKQLIGTSHTHSYADKPTQKIMHKSFNSGYLPTEQKVKCAVKDLLENNECPTVKRISKMTGIGWWKLRYNSRLYNIIIQYKELFKKKNDTEIRDAIMALRSRKIPISITTVSIYLGRSFWYIKKSYFDTFHVLLIHFNDINLFSLFV